MLCAAYNEVNLSMTDQRGIEIGYCPQCRGIRGELDRLIERAEQPTHQPLKTASGSCDDRYPQRHDETCHKGRHPTRRKSLRGELFDF
ncbi:MAG: zf-TFIIB domain-containing protein [Pseudomonadota bacterium]|nr:zf-TFIIB domain-containing protein [Pseudomonadota bacterium]